MNRHLPILAFLLLSIPVFSHAQSLGDLARELRAEKSKGTLQHATVITNDDIAKSAPSQERDAFSDIPAKDIASSDGTEATNLPIGKDPAEEWEAQELEAQHRAAEINKHYLDEIATLRDHINTAQLELGKLRGDQIDAENAFSWTLVNSPNIPAYEMQMRDLSAAIEAQRNLITSLKAQLEEAQEAARHAGVRHAED